MYKSIFSFVLLVAALPAASRAQDVAGLLPIGEAYKLSADAGTPGVVKLHWTIAKDYYLYRGQMKFNGGDGVTLGEAQLPDGKKHHDEYLGDVENYYDAIDASVPYTLAPGTQRIKLSVRYQGCHETDPKICYPPHTDQIDLPVPSAKAAANAAPSAASTPTVAAGGQASGKASVYEGTAAARAAVTQGDAADKKGDIAGAVAEYKKAIALDHDYVDAHVKYVLDESSRNWLHASTLDAKAAAKNKKDLHAQDAKLRSAVIHEYEKLVASHPHSPVYPYALAMLYVEKDIALNKKNCEKAVAADPAFYRGYECLAGVAVVEADTAKAIAYERHAMELEPDNADIAGRYLIILLIDDPAKFEAEAKPIVQRFPHSDKLIASLYFQARFSHPDSVRSARLERLRGELPGDAGMWLGMIDNDLFKSYEGTDLEKARAVAQRAVDADGKDETAKNRVTAIDVMLKARGEIQQGHGDAALVTLDGMPKKDGISPRVKTLLRAQALEAAGKTADAFALVRDDYAVYPTEAAGSALNAYGAKLGKSPAQINEAVFTQMKTKATEAKPFTLKRLDNGQNVSLADLKGKVVLMDFWFPDCGNCRQAFPLLQQIAADYKQKDFVVLSVNGLKDEEAYAWPYLKGKGYDFVPLGADNDFAQNVYGVSGYPTTFLIGPDGEIYSKPSVRDEGSMRSTELMIDALLNHAKG
jgi:thiol-disulfide isomerase/thioredoxin